MSDKFNKLLRLNFDATGNNENEIKNTMSLKTIYENNEDV